MAQAPVLSLVIALLSAFVSWKIAQSFYRRHLVIVEAQRDHYRSICERTTQAPAQPVTPSCYALTEEQYAVVVQALAKFSFLADQEIRRYVGIYVCPGATENRRFALRLKDAANEAGWDARYFGDTTLEGYESGIWIIPGHQDNKLTPPSSEVLRDALVASRVPARVDQEHVTPATWLIVGSKKD